MSKSAFRGLFLIVLGGAIALRIAALGLRPMHHDEANQAVKFGRLLEEGEYVYDKTDHHGPSLYYLTLPLAKARGQATLAALDETTLRLVPALFGIGLILLFLLFRKDIGRRAVLVGGALAALSPALVYYSRFYIQETIFVFFTVAWLAALWGFNRTPAAGRAAACGFVAGLMFATKETAVIVFAASALALVLARAAERRSNAEPDRPGPIPFRHLGLGLVVAAVTAAILFSSFLSHPKGILDAFLAFQSYFTKSGNAGFHAQPPGYYFGLLSLVRSGGLVWSEVLTLTLACLGILAALHRRNAMVLYLAAFTLVTAAVYSFIPYKTPWNLLSFYAGFVLLGGVGADFAVRSVKRAWAKALVAVVLCAGFAHLGWQSWLGNFRYPADPRNPYVYAQTSPDFLKLIRRVEAVSAVAPEHERILIKVVAGPYETWPLPWYLRRFERVGYWTDGRAAGPIEDAGLVIASPDQVEVMAPRLAAGYQSEYYGLRPNVLLTLYIRNDLWDKFIR